MNDDLTKTIDNAGASLSKMEKILEKLVQTATKFTNTLSGGIKNSGLSTSGFGAMGLGSSGKSMMGGSLGNVPAFLDMNRRMNLGYNVAQGGIKAISSLAAGAFGAMPDVSSTMMRSQGFYQASLMGGGNRTQMMNQTMRYMSGGITTQGGIPVGDVQTANIFAAAGIGVGTKQFGTLATSVGNAAKYLNVDNQQAATSMAALTQGPMSSNLMRNFGVYTTDPRTGRRLSPSEIYNALANRMTGGQKLTQEEIRTSMQGGALAVNLSQIGDQTTQDMVYQTLITNASDSKTKGGLNLGSESSMSAFAKANGINPGKSQLEINSLQAGTMNAASDSYIKGMQDAVGVLKKFHDVMNNFLKSDAGKTMARGTAMAEGIMGDPLSAGVVGGAAGAIGGLGGILGSLASNAMLGRTLNRAGLGVPTIGKNAAGRDIYTSGPNKGKYAGASDVKAAKSKLRGAKIGKAGGALAAVAGGLTIANDAMSGNGWGSKQMSQDIGGTIGGIVGSIAGSFLPAPGLGTLLGGAIGGFAGSAIGGLFGEGGEGSVIGASKMSDTKGTIKLVHPVGKGAPVTLRYGQKDSLHSNGHNGVDFGVDGASVFAAADGIVVFAGGNAANTMGTSDRSLGLQVKIKHDNGYATLYGHLSSYGVRVGDKVTAGQIIAKSGNTGYSTGPHLHFELHQNNNPIDPSSALGGNYASGGGSYNAISGSAASSSGSSSSYVGDAGTLGYSVKAASGLSIPPSYSGSSSSVAATGSAKSTRSTMIGHGASTTTTGGTSVGSPTGGATGSGGNSVVINLTIAQASDTEAKRFANMVRQYLEDDNLTSSMGQL